MNSFDVEIVTPDHTFFSGPAQALVIDTPTGKVGVLYKHEPMVAALIPGKIDVTAGEKTHSAVCTGGFMEMLGDRAYIFVQSIEWIEDIDEQRALEALERSKRHLAQAEKEQNIYEIHRHRWARERAEVRLKALRETPRVGK